MNSTDTHYFYFIFLHLFQLLLTVTVKKGQEIGGRKRGEDMRQRAVGQTQTQVGHSQPYGMPSPAQHTELYINSYCVPIEYLNTHVTDELLQLERNQITLLTVVWCFCSKRVN